MLKEVCQATGDACGGTSIDNEFFQLFVKIVGAPLMNSLSKNDPSAYLDLFREFEIVKRTINPNKKGKMNFTIPFVALDELCKNTFEEDLPTTVSSCSLSDKICLRGDKMRAEVDVLKALYSKSMVEIICHISRVLNHCNDVSMLLLVGGFSESEMLQHAIRKEFPDKRIIIPEDAAPFKLLYGWPVRGPMAILRGLSTGEDEKHCSVIEHGITVRNYLGAVPDIVKEKINAWHDKHTRFREFEPGGEVLLLLPSETLKNKADALSGV
ncbi:heat shock 70 kDa protein 12A-like [Mytilus edulis]|uniref:heat shock 70 kDa protein 12A-like n=1 Tax=Mytilus edulis TaxID=6550 RepID=UPI0039EE0A76